MLRRPPRRTRGRPRPPRTPVPWGRATLRQRQLPPHERRLVRVVVRWEQRPVRIGIGVGGVVGLRDHLTDPPSSPAAGPGAPLAPAPRDRRPAFGPRYRRAARRGGRLASAAHPCG